MNTRVEKGFEGFKGLWSGQIQLNQLGIADAGANAVDIPRSDFQRGSHGKALASDPGKPKP